MATFSAIVAWFAQAPPELVIPAVVAPVIGATLGALGAFKVAIWQLRRHQEQEESQKKAELLRAMSYVVAEMRLNYLMCRGLKHHLRLKVGPTLEYCLWLAESAEGADQTFYLSLVASGLFYRLPDSSQKDLFEFHKLVNELRNRVREAPHRWRVQSSSALTHLAQTGVFAEVSDGQLSALLDRIEAEHGHTNT